MAQRTIYRLLQREAVVENVRDTSALARRGNEEPSESATDARGNDGDGSEEVEGGAVAFVEPGARAAEVIARLPPSQQGAAWDAVLLRAAEEDCEPNSVIAEAVVEDFRNRAAVEQQAADAAAEEGREPTVEDRMAAEKKVVAQSERDNRLAAVRAINSCRRKIRKHVGKLDAGEQDDVEAWLGAAPAWLDEGAG